MLCLILTEDYPDSLIVTLFFIFNEPDSLRISSDVHSGSLVDEFFFRPVPNLVNVGD